MGKKYRRYKNFIEKYLDSSTGKRFFNVVYSVGASIVILGAMFKLLHLPFGNQMLMIGMITEAIVFLLSAFENPDKEYKWEEVFPVLADNPDFIPRNERELVNKSNTIGTAGQASIVRGTSNLNTSSTQQQSQSINNPVRTAENINISSSAANKNPATTNYSTTVNSIQVVETSQEYVDQLGQMSENMSKFAKVTDSLGSVSETLLQSFQTIIDNSEGLNNNTAGYINQIEALNRNLTGLNTIYEIQLKGVSGQINTIENINAGLDRIKKLYDGSMADSAIFKTETEKMAQQLTELNQVYARLLQAMTSNMNMGGFNTSNNNNPNPTQP